MTKLTLARGGHPTPHDLEPCQRYGSEQEVVL